MTHSELCRLTAEKYVEKSWLALWEYQSFASSEFPDVLVYNGNGSILYEIKMSRADFLADAKKQARTKFVVNGWYQIERDFIEGAKRDHNSPWDRLIRKRWISWKNYRPEEFRMQAPHLGSRRFFVCPEGVIMPDEVPEGWGLVWFMDGRFRQKRDSGKFRADMRTERNLVAHALRRLASGDSTGIIVNTYGGEEKQGESAISDQLPLDITDN